MTTHLLIQIITSFFIGGIFVTALSLLAERSGPKLSGLIISFPSTIILGFIFMGVSIPIKSVIDAIPEAIIPMGLSVLFVAYYPVVGRVVGRVTNNKNIEIIFTTFLSVFIWLGLSVLSHSLDVTTTYVRLLIFMLLILLAHLLLRSAKGESPPPVNYSKRQIILRAMFIGTVLATVVFLSHMIHPSWGAIFSAFPAAFTSMLIILHKQYGLQFLYPAMRNVALGSLSILAYMMSAIFTFNFLGLYIGSLVSAILSLLVSLVIKQLINFYGR